MAKFGFKVIIAKKHVVSSLIIDTIKKNHKTRVILTGPQGWGEKYLYKLLLYVAEQQQKKKAILLQNLYYKKLLKTTSIYSQTRL